MAAGDELVDLVDERDEVVEVVTRAELRARGASVRHRAVYVAVTTTAGELVVHRRADWKDVYPGYWDVCFGGILAAGETWDDAARRELLEEAGIDARPELAGTASWSAADTNLNARIYRATHDGPYTCPDGEVVEVTTVPLADLPAWLEGRDVCPDSVDLVLPHLPPLSGGRGAGRRSPPSRPG
jgi:8-oxo-dGTP pyrophosphatase MutT (NUDIX family)